MIYIDTSSNMSDHSTDKIAAINRQTRELTVIMHQNIDRAIQNGEQIEVIAEKAADLETDAFQFRKSATNMRRMFCRKNCKMIAIITAIIMVVILLIVAAICNGGGCHR